MRRLLAILSIYPLLAGFPAAAASSLPSVGAIVLRAQQARSGLASYVVPVTISGSVRNGLISAHFSMLGTEYFKAPDREALRMTKVPKIASGFKNTIVSMPPPADWPSIYALRLRGTQSYGSERVFVLDGTPRKQGNVASITMAVDASTYALESMTYAYRNGSNLTFAFAHGANRYQLPTGAAVSAHFPQYRGRANVNYGTYQTNVPVPDSVFRSTP